MVGLNSLSRLEETWRLADEVFHDRLLPSAVSERPITLRNPFLFYEGHLPSFAFTRFVKVLDVQSPNQPFDHMFQRGMDPDVDDPTKCHDHSEAPGQWPPPKEVVEYREKVREMLKNERNLLKLEKENMVDLIIEHDLMHIETLMYMIVQLDEKHKRAETHEIDVARKYLSCPCPEEFGKYVTIPAGTATLGRQPDSIQSQWGWDNEFGELKVHCEAFKASVLPVTVGEFLEFINQGGYDNRKVWNDEDWTWREREDIHHPRYLRPTESVDGETSWSYRTVHSFLTMEEVKDLPIYVSLAEARAYAKWRGKRLPTEAEWDRMAFAGKDEGKEHPWGADAPEPGVHGNFGFKFGLPVGVGNFAAGKSESGVLDLVGNGWELTETPFGPLPGFKPQADYPEYSADFFEGKHFVLKGASWASSEALVRRSFRNWYQGHYSYIFAKFRLCETV